MKSFIIDYLLIVLIYPHDIVQSGGKNRPNATPLTGAVNLINIDYLLYNYSTYLNIVHVRMLHNDMGWPKYWLVTSNHHDGMHDRNINRMVQLFGHFSVAPEPW